jgi:hypothetical protein
MGDSTMSALTRYRTLVHNISRVYSSQEAGRTELLQAGIDEIVTVIAPVNAVQWKTVKADTERLLHIWSVKEGGNPAASTVVAEITSILEELGAAAPVADRIAHVMPFPSIVVQEKMSPIISAPLMAPAPVGSVMPFPVVVEDAIDSEEEEEDDAEEVLSVASVSEEESEVAEPDEEIVVVKEEVASVVEAEAEAEEEEEEEVVEPEPEEEEEEEEEEAGMEVEQVMIRGRAYWKDTNTNKLYAVVRGEDGEDDVGDEVGVLENGKPRFLAK